MFLVLSHEFPISLIALRFESEIFFVKEPPHVDLFADLRKELWSIEILITTSECSFKTVLVWKRNQPFLKWWATTHYVSHVMSNYSLRRKVDFREKKIALVMRYTDWYWCKSLEFETWIWNLNFDFWKGIRNLNYVLWIGNCNIWKR